MRSYPRRCYVGMMFFTESKTRRNTAYEAKVIKEEYKKSLNKNVQNKVLYKKDVNKSCVGTVIVVTVWLAMVVFLFNIPYIFAGNV